ncbi:gastric mucin-like protein [Zalerion maritima]|uniref:Gastric mucin-like protein n=1 Tax=Zalerion maritima TaxID=339359 RepID=A0AAD5RVA2_9PEZI|nr:gastric mucin-like protein [Zalerion maritima]
MAESTYHGTVVAFEGNPDTISTQLRLLPKAPQILVLPSIQTYLPKDGRRRRFDAKRYIKEIQDASEARYETAKDFLKDSNLENKKLVFLNGGAVRAQALCIAAISENQTAGNLSRADAIYGQLVKGGITDLSEDHEARRSRMLGLDNDVGATSDPIINAMRAAELLDSETASLQPSNDIDLTSYSMKRRRSLSLPVYRYSEHMEGALPFYIFGAHQDWDSMSNRSSRYTFRDDMSIRSPLLVLDECAAHGTFLFPPKSPSCVGESYWRQSVASTTTTELLSPHSEAFTSRPGTPNRVMFGEACAVHLRTPSLRRAPKRSTSLDRATIRRSSYTETVADCRRPSKPSTESELSSMFDHCIFGSQDTIRSHGSFIDPPRVAVVRGHQPFRPSLDVPMSQFTNYGSSYVDRGVDAEDEEDNVPTLRPVLAVTEDLIVYFTEQENDAILDHVLQTFKDGTYPIQRSPPTSEVDDHIPTTPTSSHTTMPEARFPWESRPSVEITTPYNQHDDYDPYASDLYNPKAWMEQQQNFKPAVAKLRRLTPPKPPTPDSTPPPSITAGFEKKLHEFDTLSCPTAVSMQNSLRSTLNLYFPIEETGYHHFNFPLLPDMDGLWQPIFRVTDGLSSPGNGKSRVDQIMAVGSQKGVKKDFVSTITGQLEMLGSKQTGMKRSGRLDLRYLIASAMQVFTAQPLANQTQDNPFTNQYLLATLIVPHLETYLAMNPNIRFLLIEYPPEQLTTALALQQLIGVELMKVAGIINAETNMKRSARQSPSPSSCGEGLSAINIARSKTISPLFSKPSSSSSNISFPGSLNLTFSKANFLLASCASEKEVTNFIHTIWKILAETSSYYSVDELPSEARRSIIASSQPKRDVLSPPGSAGSTFPMSSRSTVSRQEEQEASLAAKLLSPSMSPHLDSPKRPISPLSQSPSIRANKPSRPGKTQRERIKNLLGTSPPSSWTERGGLNSAISIKSSRSGRTGRSIVDDDAASSFLDDDEEKADLRSEERRLMPLYQRGSQAHRTSVNGGAKALKWLGID